MQRQKLEEIIAKYRNLVDPSYDEEKMYQYERFADSVEDNIEIYEDDRFETEQDLFDDFNEVEAEVDAQWETMFPEGDDDDFITDLLTR